MTWLLKYKRYDGSETVLAKYDTKADADAGARIRNEYIQSDGYYVEEYDPSKSNWPSNPTITDIANRIRLQGIRSSEES